MIRSNADTGVRDAWRLRRASTNDVDALHGITSEPAVYRYLFDGVAPSRDAIAVMVSRASRENGQADLDLWVLCSDETDCAGCALLRPGHPSGFPELTYLLHPAYWHQGLATRMAWTTMSIAFASHAEAIVAGADCPNIASIALMKRLGMRFHRDVRYPLGPGVEYLRRRDDPAPDPPLPLLPVLTGRRSG